MKLFTSICFLIAVSVVNAANTAQPIVDTDNVCASTSDAAFFGKVGDCTHFYQCFADILYEYNCPTNQAFNPDIGLCDFPNNVKGCEYVDGLGAEEEYCRDENGDPVSKGPFAKPGTCTVYYQCTDGRLSEMQCPPSLVFNPAGNPPCAEFYQVFTPCTEGTTKFPNIYETTITTTTMSTTTTIMPTTITTMPITTTTKMSAGFNYVGFVLDNTGSMSNEIIATKEWISNCIDGKYESCATAPNGGWLVTSFNDPDTGPVVGPTSDVSTIINFIDGLTAYGGYDCPEYAWTGLKNLVEKVPDDNAGCKIFFFTDALAKDESIAADTKDLYMKKNCVFLPLLTGCCGTCTDPSCTSVDSEYCSNQVVDTTSSNKTKRRRRSKRIRKSTKVATGESLYYDLANETGGTIYLMDKPSSPDEMLDILEEEVTLGFCQTDLIAGPPPLGYTNENDCNVTGSCWDRSVGKCYCVSATESCPHDPILPEAICPAEGNIFQPHPSDCTLYYECNNGIQWVRVCAPGTVFDQEFGICNHPSDTAPPCGTKIVE